MLLSKADREVCKAAVDLYGRSMIDTIQRVDPNIWHITLKDGGVSRATINSDGIILIDPEGKDDNGFICK